MRETVPIEIALDQLFIQTNQLRDLRRPGKLCDKFQEMPIFEKVFNRPL